MIQEIEGNKSLAKLILASILIGFLGGSWDYFYVQSIINQQLIAQMFIGFLVIISLVFLFKIFINSSPQNLNKQKEHHEN